MPGIVRKLLVLADTDGLVLQPLAQRNQRAVAPVKIDYQSHTLGPLLHDIGNDAHVNEGLEVLGVIGILKVAASAFLVTVSRRQLVAQVFGKPIYVVVGASIIPIESQERAQAAIDAAKANIAELLDGDDAADVLGGDLLDEPDNDALVTPDDESLNTRSPVERSRPSFNDVGISHSGEKRKNSIAEDVITRRGLYGRFADKWFSRRGWTTGQRRNQGMSSDDDLAYPDPDWARPKFTVADESPSTSGNVTDVDENAYQKWPQTPITEKTLEAASLGAPGNTLTASLLPKLLKTTQLLFSSKTFYYSYDYDITRSLPTQRQSTSDIPLFKDVDPQYFWNEQLSMPLIDVGFNEYVLPMMQGFVGQRQFALESKSALPLHELKAEQPVEVSENAVRAAVHEPDSSDKDAPFESTQETGLQHFQLTLISRRSIHRAGLRYLRRGVDEDGHTANAVETEQILSLPSWDSSSKIYSFLQTRGSIPLFFSQIPYSFKPPPTLHGSREANLSALGKHFSELTSRYGLVQAISLVDKQGTEVQLGEEYENQVKALNEAGGVNGMEIGFEWFEFHKACRGMKFENVSFLVEKMSNFLTNHRWNAMLESNSLETQSGILRTNCMDCLDRTNVVQSACGQRILELQLASMGFFVNLTADPSTTWFNTLWADNGDAVSKAYTGTSALKGDYTRTRKRNVVGALTDLTLTLNRYYRNLFDDFFAQAAIDYLLGTVTSDVFAEFEAKMTTADPAIDLRKARQSAIATASTIVIEESEELMHGWVLKSPAVSNTLRTFPFDEVLLLLTDKAIYNVRFDWDASKVRSFERIDLRSIQDLSRGVYVTETHTPAQMDRKHNVGFVLRYTPYLGQMIGENESETYHKQIKESKDNKVSSLESKPDSSTKGSKIRPSIIRVNTRTLENVRDAWSITGADGRREEESNTNTEALDRSPDSLDSHILAFKALPTQSAFVKQRDATVPRISEAENIQMICADIAEAADKARNIYSTLVSGSGNPEQPESREVGRFNQASNLLVTVDERDIISADVAKASTGYFERMGWGIKKVLWG